MGNTAALVEVYADMDRWEDAIALLDQHPELADRSVSLCCRLLCSCASHTCDQPPLSL